MNWNFFFLRLLISTKFYSKISLHILVIYSLLYLVANLNHSLKKQSGDFFPFDYWFVYSLHTLETQLNRICIYTALYGAFVIYQGEKEGQALIMKKGVFPIVTSNRRSNAECTRTKEQFTEWSSKMKMFYWTFYLVVD